jgi:aminopeptidase N
MRSLRRLLLGAALILVAPAFAAQPPFAFATTPGALPKDVVPVEYALHIVPDIAARSFRGTGSYRIEVLQPTRRIVLHALEIEVVSAALRGPGRSVTTLGPPEADEPRQLLAFTLPAPLPRGSYTLDLAWTGRINANAEGLYADPYPSPAGPRVLLATEMEPSNARRLLPCWDEPSFRARFRLSVDLPHGFAGYSNMPVERREALPGGGLRLAFAPTPRMSSYLVALVAGELERVTAEADDTELGVVVTAGKAGRAQYALEAGKQLLPYYGDYFGTRYPLPKLDQIGVPGGFGGAMENWGAIVYTEAALLVDPASSPEQTRQTVYGTVAHEIAHQWLGNLVTMAWWDDLWLNESFAEWMAIKASERFHPEWRVVLQANEGRERAMDLDARASTHPIHQPIATESEAESAFDSITYEKGGGFLRMLEAWLGEEPFRRGIRAYLDKHHYSNTTGTDLWRVLADVSGEPVATLAADWTTQPGFPLVSVDARCEDGRREVTLRQEQFQTVAGIEGAATRRWSIPLQLRSADGGPETRVLLQAPSATRVLSGCDGALLVDAGNVGFYRVRYARPLFEALLAEWPRLPDAARMKLLSDTGALVRADQVALASWLDLVARLGDEPRLALWTRVVNELADFDRLLLDEPSRPALDRFAVRLIAPRFAQLGWEEKAGESGEDRQLRGLLAGALARHGDAGAIAESRARFARFLADRASLPPALLAPVLQSVGRYADAATWEQLRALAAAAPTSEERFRYFRALGEARDPALAERNLRLALAADVPRLMRREMVAMVAASGHLPAAWAFAREHADALLADITLHGGGRYFGRVVDSAASAAIADELEAFVATRLPADALADARRAGDEIRTRARLKARLAPQLAAALPAS